MNKPIAMEMAACAWDSTWNHGELKGYLYAPIRFLRDKIITANVDYVIYVSQNFLQNRYPTNAVTTIASNVRLSRPDDLVLESRLQKIESKDLDEDILTIGLIGPLGHKIKGIHIALQALSHIEKDKPGKFIFKVLGPGNPENYRIMASELGIEHCVIFEGIIRSGDGVLKWLDDIDIYIQPSFQEGVPRATIEAMSRGCPCLGSMAGGIPELLDNKRLHKPGDIKTLKTHLEKMLTSKENQLEAAKYNFKKVSRYYSDELTPIREKFWGEFKDFAAEKVSIKNSGVKNGARNTTISKTLVAK
ncbi:MAG: glycosyltransferase family 4 protein [Micavibrio sp.]|nr:glycosyltransferase family 4 protein [Micavibrio sp.]